MTDSSHPRGRHCDRFSSVAPHAGRSESTRWLDATGHVLTHATEAGDAIYRLIVADRRRSCLPTSQCRPGKQTMQRFCSGRRFSWYSPTRSSRQIFIKWVSLDRCYVDRPLSWRTVGSAGRRAARLTTGFWFGLGKYRLSPEPRRLHLLWSVEAEVELADSGQTEHQAGGRAASSAGPREAAAAVSLKACQSRSNGRRPLLRGRIAQDSGGFQEHLGVAGDSVAE